MQMKKFGVLVPLLTMAVSAYAIEGEGFYVGGQLGITNVKNKPKYVQTSPSTSVLVNPKNTGPGGRLFLGYNISQYGGLELGWTYYAPSKYDPDVSTVCGTPNIRQSALDIVAKGILPFSTTGFDVFGKAGMAIVRQASSGRLTSTTLNPCSSTTAQTSVRPEVGIGASYAITQNWVTDLSWTRIIGGGGNVKNSDLYAVGLAYHLVDKRCGQFLC
jgi:opacity protein-like surface antigen